MPFNDEESCRQVKVQTWKNVNLTPERTAEVSKAYCRLVRKQPLYCQAL